MHIQSDLMQINNTMQAHLNSTQIPVSYSADMDIHYDPDPDPEPTPISLIQARAQITGQ